MLTFSLLALLTTTAIAVAIGKPIEAADDLMANEAILSSPLASTAAAAAAPPGGNHGSTSQQHVSTTDTDASRNLEMLSSLGQVPPPPLPPASWPLPPPASLEPRGGTGTAATTTEVEVVTAAAAAGDLAFPTTSNSTSPAIVERGVRTENAALGKKFLCSKMYLWFDNQWGLAVPSEWWQEKYDNDAKAACHDYKKSVRHAFGGYLHYKWNCYKLDSEEAVRWQAYDPYILAASGWLRIQFVTPLGVRMWRGKHVLYSMRDPIGYEQNHVPIDCKRWSPFSVHALGSDQEHLNHKPHKIQD